MLTSSAVTGVFHSLSCGLAPERSRPFSPGLTGLLALGATLTLRELGEPAESAENLPNYRNPAGASGAASSKKPKRQRQTEVQLRFPCRWASAETFR